MLYYKQDACFTFGLHKQDVYFTVFSFNKIFPLIGILIKRYLETFMYQCFPSLRKLVNLSLLSFYSIKGMFIKLSGTNFFEQSLIFGFNRVRSQL